MISINWATRVIYVPQSYMTNLGGGIYELNVNQFRLDLKDIEDSEDGINFPVTHSHNTTVVLSGVTYARTFEIINDYTVEFQDGNYTVKCTGANHNIGDVKVVNQVSLLIGNSAGLIEAGAGSILNQLVEPGYSVADTLRLLLAVAAGKTQITDLGGGAAEVIFRDVNDTTNRVVADMQDSERILVTKNP